MVEREASGLRDVEGGGAGLFLAGAGEGGEDAAGGVDVLGDAGAAEAEDRDAVFAGAERGDAGVELVLLGAPIGDVHEGNDDDLGASLDEAVHDVAIAEVVTDGDGDFAPRENSTLPEMARRGRP